MRLFGDRTWEIEQFVETALQISSAKSEQGDESQCRPKLVLAGECFGQPVSERVVRGYRLLRVERLAMRQTARAAAIFCVNRRRRHQAIDREIAHCHRHDEQGAQNYRWRR